MNRTIPKDKWVLDANSFWRHSLGCALANQTLAQRISYPEPEKAYLTGLLHHLDNLSSSAGPLTCLVRLGDLLCRVRNLGYGV